MAKNIFISFRYSDGINYKNELTELFKEDDDTLDYSEDKDRSMMSEETIKKYLYGKLARSSVTIVLLTPKAICHQKDYNGKYDDWMYDEIKYSLEDRENNRTNGLIAVYVPEAKDMLISCNRCSNMYCEKACNIDNILPVDNLFRKNIMNVKNEYKTHNCNGIYDNDYDSYCSLISYEEFKNNYEKYIKIAEDKRDNTYKYDINKRLQ